VEAVHDTAIWEALTLVMVSPVGAVGGCVSGGEPPPLLGVPAKLEGLLPTEELPLEEPLLELPPEEEPPLGDPDDEVSLLGELTPAELGELTLEVVVVPDDGLLMLGVTGHAVVLAEIEAGWETFPAAS
jgi:hypothetical protein